MYLSPFWVIFLSQVSGVISTSTQYFPRYAPGGGYFDARDVDDELWIRDAEPGADADANALLYDEDLSDLGLYARDLVDLYERELDELYARMEPGAFRGFDFGGRGGDEGTWESPKSGDKHQGGSKGESKSEQQSSGGAEASWKNKGGDHQRQSGNQPSGSAKFDGNKGQKVGSSRKTQPNVASSGEVELSDRRHNQ